VLAHPLSPTSPSFPYTTLFRSVGPCIHSPSPCHPPQCRGSGGKEYRHPDQGFARGFPTSSGLLDQVDRFLTYPLGQSGQPDLPRDRKSTRLNSSHVSISYAVFC